MIYRHDCLLATIALQIYDAWTGWCVRMKPSDKQVLCDALNLRWRCNGAGVYRWPACRIKRSAGSMGSGRCWNIHLFREPAENAISWNIDIPKLYVLKHVLNVKFLTGLIGLLKPPWKIYRCSAFFIIASFRKNRYQIGTSGMKVCIKMCIEEKWRYGRLFFPSNRIDGLTTHADGASPRLGSRF